VPLFNKSDLSDNVVPFKNATPINLINQLYVFYPRRSSSRYSLIDFDERNLCNSLKLLFLHENEYN